MKIKTTRDVNKIYSDINKIFNKKLQKKINFRLKEWQKVIPRWMILISFFRWFNALRIWKKKHYSIQIIAKQL